MIRYRLLCNEGHNFDAWFRNSDDFEQQKMHKFVSCPFCQSTAVDRGLMAPAIAKKQHHENKEKKTESAQEQTNQDGKENTYIPTLSSPQVERVVSLMRDFKKAVMDNAIDVGSHFAEEARKIHYGDTESYGIYGTATVQEVKELTEDGIEILPLPTLPEEQN